MLLGIPTLSLPLYLLHTASSIKDYVMPNTTILPTTVSFLQNLQHNNNRAWFEAHRKEYLVAKENFAEVFAEFVAGVASFDKQIANQIDTSSKIFRIFRDARFGKDKTPYKSNFGGVVAPGGMQMGYGCYYLHLEPGNHGIAGGIHIPQAPALEKIRTLIANKYGELQKILAEPQFKKMFGDFGSDLVLKKTPRGFAPEHPAAKYLKLKSFTVWKSLADKEVCSKNFLDQTLERIKILKPLNDFLNRAI